MNEKTIALNKVMAFLFSIAFIYNLFTNSLSVASLIGGVFVVIAPLTTIYALTRPSTTIRRVALVSNGLILLVLLLGFVVLIFEGFSIGMLVVVPPFIPNAINFFVLIRQPLSTGVNNDH